MDNEFLASDYNPLPEGELLPPPPPPVSSRPEPVENPPFTFWDVIGIAVIALVSVVILEAITATIALKVLGRKLADVTHDPRLILPPEVAAYVIVLAFMVLILRSRGNTFWRSIKWRWPSQWPVYLVFGVGLSVIVQFGSELLPIPKHLPIDKYFADTTGTWLLAIFGVTIAPLMEELFFRGFLYPVLARRLGMVLSILITAFGFALLHGDQLGHAWAPLLLLFVVGIVLTLVRARTGSVAASFLMHVGYNLTIFTILFFATDHFHNFQKLG